MHEPVAVVSGMDFGWEAPVAVLNLADLLVFRPAGAIVW